MKTVVTHNITRLAVVSLLVLPGCDLFKSSSSANVDSSSMIASDDGSAVLVLIEGKPVVTQKMFDSHYDQLIAMNPQLQQFAAIMPNIKRNILDGLVHEKIVLWNAEKMGIHETEDYKNELAQAMRAAKVNFAAKNFEKQMVGPIEVTEDDVKQAYDARKDTELLISKGGISADGVEFSSKEKATAFLEKAKTSAKNIKAVAGTEKVKEFAPISEFSFDIDEAVKSKVLGITKFPSVVMVESSDKKFWVIAATSKKESQYRSYDEVKEQLKPAVKNEKGMKAFMAKIEDLKTEYNVVINEDLFKGHAAPAEKHHNEDAQDVHDQAGHSHVDMADDAQDTDQAPEESPVKAL